MSQSQCGRSPSQAGYHRRLGEPLSHQLANGTQAHPQASSALCPDLRGSRDISGITPHFWGLSRT